MAKKTTKNDAPTLSPQAERVRKIVERARSEADDIGSADVKSGGSDWWSTIPLAADPAVVDADVLKFCAALDQSDTSNGQRLFAHFNGDIRVFLQAKAKDPSFVVWDGRRWNMEVGNQKAQALAQLVGDRIQEEPGCLSLTEGQEKLIAAAEKAEKKEEGDRSAADNKLIMTARRIEAQLQKKIGQRLSFGVSSKNQQRIGNMLKTVAPHIMVPPEKFNADPYRVAVTEHTLQFARSEERELNPEIERDDAPADTPEFVTRRRAKCIATPGHRRADLITEFVPTNYDPDAACPRFAAFLEEFLPDRSVRDCVQVAAGLGLLGLTVQKLFFHYGNGANGKSVFLEVVCRVLGDNAVTLPSESFIGKGKEGGGPSPDVARLHGRRLLRVQELPEGEDLREDLVKKLTGGEAIAVRDLFAGYFDFHPIFVAHMSGNGYPKISGTDNGIWRRITVIPWTVTIDESRQRNFEDVVSEFMEERSGVLNWMIAGALRYMDEGLKVPEAIAGATKEYREAMDPTSGFINRCVRPAAEDAYVLASELYVAYERFCDDVKQRPISGTKFGMIMGKKYRRIDSAVRKYVGIKLVDVPAPPSNRQYPDGYGGGSE